MRGNKNRLKLLVYEITINLPYESFAKGVVRLFSVSGDISES